MSQDRGTIRCYECSETHTAEYSYDSPIDGKRIYEVVCTRDNQSDMYTAEAITFGSES